MKLKDISSGKLNASEWEAKGYKLPTYDIEAVRTRTHENPTWVHFGGGNIFRAFPAAILNDLLNKGVYDRGVIVAETFDYEVVDKAYTPYDNLSLLVSLQASGTIEKKVIASVTESLKADYAFDDWSRLVDIFRNPSLQMATFTITEKGYGVPPADLERGLKPMMAMGKVTALLYERFKAGKLPLTVQSMDNCSHNGDKVKAGVIAYAKRWAEERLAPQAFVDYLEDEQTISFPWSMIDKITPRPHAKVKEMLAADGFEDNQYIETEKHTFTAPFVNSEETQYLVVEDHYTNGRPPLDQAGVIYTTRKTVDEVETMKVTTCLNPLHTAMALYGCMLNYTLISAEMNDEDIRPFIQKLDTSKPCLSLQTQVSSIRMSLLAHSSIADCPTLHARHAATHCHGHQSETAHTLWRDHQEVCRSPSRYGQLGSYSPRVGRLRPLPEGCRRQRKTLHTLARPHAAGATTDCGTAHRGQGRPRLQLPEEPL